MNIHSMLFENMNNAQTYLNIAGHRDLSCALTVPFKKDRGVYVITMAEKKLDDIINIKCTVTNPNIDIIYSLSNDVRLDESKRGIKQLCDICIDNLANNAMRAIIMDSDLAPIVSRYEGVLNKRYVYRNIAKCIIEGNVYSDFYCESEAIYKKIIRLFDHRTKKILNEIAGIKPSIKNLWGLLK